MIFDVSGKSADSTLTVTGSNITVGASLYNHVEGDVLYQALTQTDTTNNQNSSKGAGLGAYVSTQIGSGQSNQGFTVNISKAKGNSQEIATTHTNTQVTVGGTTVNDIGGNLILDGANLNTKHLTGTVGNDLIVKSRQDTYQYTHDQKQAGFSADVVFNGKPQSFSINGGKTNIDADYAQVAYQLGIKAQESTLSVQGQGKFTGGYLITDAGKNQTQFAQGIQTQDIENHLNYKGDAISVGIGVDTSNPDGKAKPALQGIGYGTIDPVNKTSTTYSAITDQAGLDHINTENFKQEEIQNQLNQIITNDFNKERVLTELNAQVNITTEFGREAPKAVAQFSQYQQDAILSQLQNIEHLSDEQINDILSEAAKWGEGGIYRVALHTATAALATGTIEGAASAGGAAYAIPKIDEYLKEQGFDKTTRHSALLALSVGIGATIGSDTASTVNNVGQVQWNYLTHTSLEKVRKGQLTVEEAERLSQRLDKEAEQLCSNNPTGDACRTAISSQIQYIAMQEAWSVMRNDVSRTSKQTFNYLYNTPNAQDWFVIYFNTIDNRANFFAASNQYEKNLGVGARWDDVSRARFTGLGADGNLSYVTFGVGSVFSGNPKHIYDWRKEAGDALMKGGFDNFRYLYNNRPNAMQWDIKQLRDEQTLLQPIHEKYLSDSNLFRWFSKQITDSENRKYIGRLIKEEQTQPSGIDILDKSSRIRYGCKLLGYTEQQGCKP